MGSQENGDGVFQKRNGVDHFYGSDWDPMVGNFVNSSPMVHQNEFVNNNPHYPSLLENQIMGSSSHLVQFPSDPSLVDVLPKLPSFGSGNFSEMVTSFGHIGESGSHPNYSQNNGIGIQRTTTKVAESKDHCQNSGDGALGASPNVKRKRKVSLGASPKNAEQEKQQGNSEFSKDDDEKKQKFGKDVGASSSGEQTNKQANDNSGAAEPAKENYIHVRAKRGQATNSHSLAERVRRERISERMRLLQELVPGCNKITGKAVMLDEIINYVQSLQQQVEFLSMKLATVNPELNVDIERILSKDILHSQGSNINALGSGLALSSPHPFPGYSHGSFVGAPPTTSQFLPAPHNLWNNTELQSLLQVGFDSDPSINNMGPNGMSKMEL